MPWRVTAWCLLVLSTLGGIISVYWLLFSIWMTADPLHDSQMWRIRVHKRFGITVLDALIWVGSILWLWRTAKSRQTPEYATIGQRCPCYASRSSST